MSNFGTGAFGVGAIGNPGNPVIVRDEFAPQEVGPLAHPLRLSALGDLITLPGDTVAAYAQEVAILVLTRRGERPLAPGYGIDDPVVVGVDPAQVAAGLELYGPPVTADSVTTRAVSDTQLEVRVELELTGA
jgi:hypothetical protein